MESTETATQPLSLACALAVLGDGTPAAVAARLAGLCVEEGERAADSLAGAGILAPGRPLRFTHAGVRAALYSCLPRGERAIAHRRAIRVLGEAGAGPMALVAHACAVEPAGDGFVAGALIAAGRTALATGTPRQAALLLERALAEPPARVERACTRLLLARALTLLGDRRAPDLTYEALSAATPHERPRITSQLIDALWLTGGVDAAIVLAAQTAGGEPAGIAAARAAREGSLAAADVVRAAAIGVRGETAFERCCAIAALIACDELAQARRSLDACTRTAVTRGADAELAMLARLRTRLRAAEGTVLDGTRPLPGPDPGPAPWKAWLADAEKVQRFGTRSARAAALLAAGGGTEQLEAAVALLRGSPRPALLGQALLALGRALRHGGQRRRARVALTEAAALAEYLGAAELAAQARDELRIAGARPRRELLTGPASLTAAERRVADVAAEGSSNREIATRLFVSPKTVEMHLGRVYRKLDIGSRGELPCALGGIGDLRRGLVA